MELIHKIDTPLIYSCVVCRKPIHGGDTCNCSTIRHEAFNYASICIECAEIYDKLTSEEFQPVLKELLRREYWKARGPVNDF